LDEVKASADGAELIRTAPHLRERMGASRSAKNDRNGMAFCHEYARTTNGPDLAEREIELGAL
jgi:hypothetical protein